MKIERAVREKTFTLSSIAGPSGSGKTYSALLYARGLVGPDGKIGLIDTENKRSRFYADIAGGFDVIDLDPPFTSQRYMEAISAFEKAGYTAIVIDSISHEWEGTGGVLEQAEAIEQATKRSGLHCWAKPKAGHKKMMNAFLQTRAHLIFCCRVKEKVVQAKVNGKTEIVNEGFVVVQEKSFIYEMTVSMMLDEGSHVPTIQKCPGDLLSAFPSGKALTIDAGAAVREWSDQGVALDPEIEDAKRAGLLAANEGLDALQTWWKSLDLKLKSRLEGMKDTFKSIATAADQIRKDIADVGGGTPGERLNAARAASQHPTDEQEGFDSGKVARELGNVPSAQDSADPISAETSPPADADAGEAESLPATSPASTELDRLKAYARDVLSKAANPETSADQIKAIEARWATEIGKMSDDAKEKAKAIAKSMRSVFSDPALYDGVIDHYAGLFGCEPDELMPAGEDA